MTAYLFLISVLSVWRVTHLIQAEDGPFDVIYKLRKLENTVNPVVLGSCNIFRTNHYEKELASSNRCTYKII
jgi:hypothetical protein